MREELSGRSGGVCELCQSDQELEVYAIMPQTQESLDNSALICSKCRDQINQSDELDEDHWRCLAQAMWSEHIAVQVLCYRVMKNLLTDVGWAQDLIPQMFFEEDIQRWADDFGVNNSKTLDSNGSELSAGDTVTLIKDLDVKGANFTAKRGTVVKNIRLTDNPEHIEGKVNGTLIVLVAKFLKRA